MWKRRGRLRPGKQVLRAPSSSQVRAGWTESVGLGGKGGPGAAVAEGVSPFPSSDLERGTRDCMIQGFPHLGAPLPKVP